MITVLVASKNPAKVDGTAVAFKELFPDETFRVEGVLVPPVFPDGVDVFVSEQPRTNQETKAGAAARLMGLERFSAHQPADQQADFLVALEAGVDDQDGQLMVFTWAAISTPHHEPSFGRSASFVVPPCVAQAIRGGSTMFAACRAAYAAHDPNRVDGLITLLSNGKLTRTSQCTAAVMMALLPFVRPELY